MFPREPALEPDVHATQMDEVVKVKVYPLRGALGQAEPIHIAANKSEQYTPITLKIEIWHRKNKRGRHMLKWTAEIQYYNTATLQHDAVCCNYVILSYGYYDRV